MKPKYRLLAGAFLAASLVLSTQAQSRAPFGAEKEVHPFVDIEVKSYDDETLGRIKDLAVDLVNGRIVEVLVVVDSSLDAGRKMVAVPPFALVSDPGEKIYRLNTSVEEFRSAPGVEPKHWSASVTSERVAAAYRMFGQEPYFIEEGVAPGKTARRPKVPLGYVERCNFLLDLPVSNLRGDKFGNVWSLTLDIPQGRILNVTVQPEGEFKTMRVLPAMALSFNEAHNGLLLDESKHEFKEEPRMVFTEAAFGNEATEKEQAYEGPHTSDRLEQGTNYRDVDRTVQINRAIRAAKINRRNVQVGTVNGRVTLRGWVDSEDDRRRIGEIAIAVARLELVDNQLTVGKPGAR